LQTVTLSHDGDAPPGKLWEIAANYDLIAVIMRGIISFDGLPSGTAQTGVSFEVMGSLFGKFPAQPYRMEVPECDAARRILRTHEKGAGVTSWRQTLRIELPEGCRLIDQIEIDAGLVTPLFALRARFLYRNRHKPRLRLLAS
jgi:hypothetical protein